MARLLAAVGYLLAAALATRWLWQFWTPHCNEACPEGTAVAMYLILVVLVGGAAWTSVLTALGRVRLSRSVMGVGALAAIVGLAAAMVTRGLHAQ